MTTNPSFSFVKPSVNTPFHIDFEWWKQHDNDWRVFLINCLCPEHKAAFSGLPSDQLIDWVDPETAEIKLVDGVQSTLMSHCAQQPGFFTQNTAMVDAIFRVFMSNGNNPLNARELSDRIGKPAETILRTISGFQVYKGIRPCR